MNEENLHPNNSPLAFQEPVERVTDRNKDKAESLKAMPVIEAELERLKERVAFHNSNSAIKADLAKSPEVHQQEMYANQVVIKYLVSEIAELEEKIEDYRKM